MTANNDPLHICPHLGLDADRTIVASVPSHGHICYAQSRQFSPAIEHQAQLCLRAEHTQCEFYLASQHKRSDASPERAYAGAAPTEHAAGGKRITITLILGLALILLGGTAYWALGGSVPAAPGVRAFLARFATPTPVVAPTASADTAPASTVSEDATAIATATPPPAPSPMVTPMVEDQQAPSPAIALLPEPTSTPARTRADALSTPGSGVTSLEFTPRAGEIGWWQSEGVLQANLRDSFLYAGNLDGTTYIAAARFDLSRLPRGAELFDGKLQLTGLRENRLLQDNNTMWLVQLIAESELATLAEPQFLTIYSAPAAITLVPPLSAADVAVGRVNEWTLNASTLDWLEQQVLNGAAAVTVRIIPAADAGDSLFAWDSGQGPESGGHAPALIVQAGPPPPTPPPLPTRQVVVATLTPTPDNVLTVVAYAETATVVASIFGTNTPVPYEVWTPTPRPENLATVQANAIAQGLPPVVLHTRVPGNVATAAADAAYATAVALTTGTFTPVPTNFVTPVLVYPSPPAENVATAAARAVEATAQAAAGVPVPTLPWNAWEVEYIYATPTPGNLETAIAVNQALNDAILTTGTPTPTPENLVVITRVPTPPGPAPTPIPLIIPAEAITPTPTPTPTRVVSRQQLDNLRNMILFQSDRSGLTQTWVLDPSSGTVTGLVTEPLLYDIAREAMLTFSPNGNEQAVVQEDHRRLLQIKVASSEYNTVRQITNFDTGIAYDPAWSPLGDRIAFVSNASGGDEVYVTDPNGDVIERLTFNTWEWDKHPTWSPDGAQIAFMSNRGSGRAQIWIMNADGSGQRNLTNDEYSNWDPVWIR